MEPPEVKYSLGAVSRIVPNTFGEPGQRTFNLVLESGEARCTVWLEKEQLFQLALKLQEVMERLSDEDKARQSQDKESAWSGEGISLDFKVGQMALEYDQDSNSFRMMAYEREEEATEEGSSVSFWISLQQAGSVSEEALQICAAGRPRCFLCGLPINPDGHVCPRANGHTVLEAG
jgi:uncharacterized repeat protein (TIGR03847 family)